MSTQEISLVREAQVLVIRISGRLDTLGGPALEEFCREHLAADERRVVFDLTQTNYVSSAGLRGILKLTKVVEAAGGVLVLCGLQDMVATVFYHAGFDTFLKIEKNLQDAIRILES